MATYPTDQQKQAIADSIGKLSGVFCIDIPELSKRTTLSRWTIYNLVNQRNIPHMKIGRRVIFPIKEIEKWLHEQTIGIVER